MVRMEQRLTIGEAGVCGELQIDKITNRSRCCSSHGLGNGGKLTQVVIDNGLVGNRENIALRRQRDRDAVVTCSDVFVFSPLWHLFQFRETIQAHTFCFMEVRQGACFSPLLESLAAVLPACEYGLFSPTSKDLGKVAGSVRKGQIHNL